MQMFDADDLTDADLAFLKQFNELGRSDTADAEYNPDLDDRETTDEPGDDAPGENGDGSGQGGKPDPEAESDGGFDGEGSGEGDGKTESDEGEIDESRMDISDLETQQPQGEGSKGSSDEAEEKDHLEGGETDSEIQDGEDDLEYDDLSNEDLDGHVDDDKAADNDELPDPELDDTEDSGEKVAEDDGEGERANSDEARESDEPIGGSDSDGESEEADDDPEAEQEAGEQESEKAHEQEPRAEGDSEFEGDAQQELEDHLRGNQEKDNGEDEKREEGERYADLPDPREGCSDHCEDNMDEDAEHECPRCAERVMRERKQWGVIATDINGIDVYAGDKLRVVISMPFFVPNSILTANVPNSEMERVAQKTDGTSDPNACWLSGNRISQFTGWNQGGRSVWTFTKGRELRFAAKIGEPEREGGGQGDIEDKIEELKQDLENFENQNEPPEEDEPQEEEETEETDDDTKTIGLTSTQMFRYNNLFKRLGKKVESTFGSTAESIEYGEITVQGKFVARPMMITSRGVQYTFVLTAKRNS